MTGRIIYFVQRVGKYSKIRQIANLRIISEQLIAFRIALVIVIGFNLRGKFGLVKR